MNRNELVLAVGFALVSFCGATGCGMIGGGGDKLPAMNTDRHTQVRICDETDHLQIATDATSSQNCIQQFTLENSGDSVQKAIYFTPNRDGRFVLNVQDGQLLGEAFGCTGSVKDNGADLDFKLYDPATKDYSKDPVPAGDPKNNWYDFAIHSGVELRILFTIHNVAHCTELHYLYLPTFSTTYPMPAEF